MERLEASVRRVFRSWPMAFDGLASTFAFNLPAREWHFSHQARTSSGRYSAFPEDFKRPYHVTIDYQP
jgi:hypothetical protein